MAEAEPLQPRVVSKTMEELVEEANSAMRLMSNGNPHKMLILNMARALMSCTERLVAAIEVLIRVEWVMDADHQESCPWCDNTRAFGHAAHCERAAFLDGLRGTPPPGVPAAADGPDQPSGIILPTGVRRES